MPSDTAATSSTPEDMRWLARAAAALAVGWGAAGTVVTAALFAGLLWPIEHQPIAASRAMHAVAAVLAVDGLVFAALALRFRSAAGRARATTALIGALWLLAANFGLDALISIADRVYYRGLGPARWIGQSVLAPDGWWELTSAGAAIWAGVLAAGVWLLRRPSGAGRLMLPGALMALGGVTGLLGVAIALPYFASTAFRDQPVAIAAWSYGALAGAAWMGLGIGGWLAMAGSDRSRRAGVAAAVLGALVAGGLGLAVVHRWSRTFAVGTVPPHGYVEGWFPTSEPSEFAAGFDAIRTLLLFPIPLLALFALAWLASLRPPAGARDAAAAGETRDL